MQRNTGFSVHITEPFMTFYYRWDGHSKKWNRKKDFKQISFCISAHGEKKEKNLLVDSLVLLHHIGAFVWCYNILQYHIHKRRKLSSPHSVICYQALQSFTGGFIITHFGLYFFNKYIFALRFRMAHFLFRISLKPFKNMTFNEYCVPIQIQFRWIFIVIRLLDYGTFCQIRIMLKIVRFVSIRSMCWSLAVIELKHSLVSVAKFLCWTHVFYISIKFDGSHISVTLDRKWVMEHLPTKETTLISKN